MEKNMKRTPGPVVMSLRQVVVERGAFKLSVKSMDLRRGEIACLVGTNGCGKTTLLLTALGMMPHRGKCTLNGLQYDGSNPRLRALVGNYRSVGQGSIRRALYRPYAPGGATG
jgi:ABC-type branched-subunit amino acid transport system ATPase component